jgi:ABC-2 type transport system permease protein
VRNALHRLSWALGLCWHYALQRQKADMAYRADFLVNFFVNIGYSIMQLFFLWAIFYRVPTLAGWTFEQVVLIFGCGQISFGYFSVFCFELAVGFTDYYVIEGNLDRPLLRPISPLLQLVMENITLREVTVIIKGTAIVWWALAHLKPAVPMTFGVFCAAQVMGMLGAVVYAGVFLAVAAAGFWIKDRVGLSSPLFSISEAGRYPLTIYHPAVQVFFSVIIPFGFCAFYPAVYFTDPTHWASWLIAGPFVAAAALAAGMALFKQGLRVYESTGS